MSLLELTDKVAANCFLSELSYVLEQEGLSQADLARAAGLPEQNISRWLRGHVRPSRESLIRLDVAHSVLMNREGNE